MSVVVLYSCIKYAMIMTDTMVTASWGGHYESNKLYEFKSMPFGHCAGAGLEDGIFKVRDALSSITAIKGKDIVECLEKLKNDIEHQGAMSESHTAFSFGMRHEGKAECSIMVVSIETSNSPKMSNWIIDQEKFTLMAPNEFRRNNEWQNELESLYAVNQKYTDEMGAVIRRGAQIFDFIQCKCQHDISRLCHIGLLLYDQEADTFERIRVEDFLNNILGSEFFHNE